MKRKLNFEIVPSGCWKLNLRTILPKNLWDFIKKDARSRANNKCSICNQSVKTLHAHEVWEYDVKLKTVKLKDVISVCPTCHSAIHINRTALKGDEKKAEDKYMKVNNVTYAQMKQDLKEQNLLNLEREKVDEWKMDLSWLKRFTEE